MLFASGPNSYNWCHVGSALATFTLRSKPSLLLIFLSPTTPYLSARQMTSAFVNQVSVTTTADNSPSPSSSATRKRQRVSDSDEDREARKEARALARAQRNRLAAQESRDRRKKEFSELHSRVAQLEAENAALRESKPSAVIGNERTERLERENAELLERYVESSPSTETRSNIAHNYVIECRDWSQR